MLLCAAPLPAKLVYCCWRRLLMLRQRASLALLSKAAAWRRDQAVHPGVPQQKRRRPSELLMDAAHLQCSKHASSIMGGFCLYCRLVTYRPHSRVCKHHAWVRCSPACLTRAELMIGRTHRQAGVPRSAPEAAGVDDGLAGGGQQHERSARRRRPPLAQVLQHKGDRLAEPAARQSALGGDLAY